MHVPKQGIYNKIWTLFFHSFSLIDVVEKLKKNWDFGVIQNLTWIYRHLVYLIIDDFHNLSFLHFFYRLTLHLQNSVWMTITQCITTIILVWFSREFCLLWLSSNSTTRFIMLSKYDGKIWEVINGSSSMVKFKDFSWIGNKKKKNRFPRGKSKAIIWNCNVIWNT